MNFEYEKDYIMRIIKEMVRILFSLLFGKKQVAVEQEDDFLKQHHYSREEAFDGLKQLLCNAGFGDLIRRIFATDQRSRIGI